MMKTHEQDFTYEHILGFGELLGLPMTMMENPEMVRMWGSDMDFPIDFIIVDQKLLARAVFVKEGEANEEYAEFILRFRDKEGATRIKPNLESGRIWPMIWTGIGISDLDPEELRDVGLGLFRTTRTFGEEALSRFSLRKQFEK